MGIVFPECPCVEIPYRGMVHDVESIRAKECIVYSSVALLHESYNFTLLINATPNAYRADEALHDKVATE